MKFVLFAAILVACAAGSLAFGPVSIPISEIVSALTSPDPNSTTHRILREFRMPRVVLAILVGAGLASSGAAYQSLFRNPLADPFVMGTASGAAFGASLVIALGFSSTAFGVLALPFGAFLGALAATGVVYAIGSFAKQSPMVNLLLAGMAVSSFLSSVVWLMLTLSREVQGTILTWLMGSFAERGWTDVAQSVPYLVVGLAILWIAARPLDALSMGEDSARGLGLPVKFATAWIVLGASLATAAAVAASGIIGFVGLIAPHVARRFVGPKHVVLLPASAIVGAILLLIADILARVSLPPHELRVGIITALLGAPFFLVILFRRVKP